MPVVDKLQTLAKVTLPVREVKKTTDALSTPSARDAGLTPEQLIEALETAKRMGLI